MSWLWISLVSLLRIYSKSAEENLTCLPSYTSRSKCSQEFKWYMKKELSIEILNRIILWLEELKQLKTQFILLISVWLNATNLQTVSTSHSRMERTWQEQPDMPLSILTLGTSSLEEIAWNRFVTFSFISWRDLFLGKVSQDDQKLRSMPISKRRKRKCPLRNCAKEIQNASRKFYTTAKNLASLKIQIINTLLTHLNHVWNKMILIQPFLTSFGTKIDWFLRRKPSRHRWWRLSKRNQEPRIDTTLLILQFVITIISKCMLIINKIL